MTGNLEFYPDKRVFQTGIISKGKFQLSGSCPHPSMFLLRIDVDTTLLYVSDEFMLESGVQNIICNVDSLRELPRIENKYVRELRNDYLPSLNTIVRKRDLLYDQYDSLSKSYDKNIPDAVKMKFENEKEHLQMEADHFILNYAKGHPNSYILLWKLIARFSSNGYKPVFDSAYNYLSPSLRSSFAGEVLTTKITNMRALAVGATFPSWPLLDTNLAGVQTSFRSKQTKFILVDFWYSHCGACIGQFEELKNIWKENAPYGFSVLGISIDSRNYIQDWKNVIHKYELPWTQYLDMDYVQASKYTISYFPTNFLLDKNGKILKRDIDMKSLSLFLEKNIR